MIGQYSGEKVPKGCIYNKKYDFVVNDYKVGQGTP